MGAANKVIAGDFKDRFVGVINGRIVFMLKRNDVIYFDKTDIESYELITDEHRKSASSGIARGAIGATLLGPVGLLAGLTAKTKSIYTIAIKFKDGQNSLIEINEGVYKELMKALF